MKELRLNGEWDLREEALSVGPAEASAVAAKSDGWIASPVPGDIHQGLVAAGRIKEPLLGLNSFDCQWTQDRSWWYRKSFATKPEWLKAGKVELELNGLDSNAFIFLNGVLLGNHKSCFFPFVADIKKALKPSGANVLLVRLTTGVETVTQEDMAPMGVMANTEEWNGRSERGEPRRPFVRKPQFSFGWDWSPRTPTTAIAGDAVIRWIDHACIRDVRVRPVRENNQVILNVTATIDLLTDFASSEGKVAIRIVDEKKAVLADSRTVFLRSGLNHVDFRLPVKNPRYWWPNGMGNQHLYTVQADLEAGKEKSLYPAFKYGLRFIELDTEGKFAFVINGKKIFCKGANWIPADALYARVTDERYDFLVREARNANFNMLRVWGGGLYEPKAFYEACDRYGILLWHDFMFACAPYPDHLDWFNELVHKEAEYQTVRLRNHACMAVWSGNNENSWGFAEWWPGKTRSGAYLYNYLLPETVRRNCPEIPYWNGSPYGGAMPNSPDVGDRHHWNDCTMNPEMQKRITPEEYDRCTSLFVSEYGYIGAPGRETVTAYLDGAEFDRQSKVWQHHNNTFEKNTVDAGIGKHYADPASISIDDYFLYSGLCQGLMYGYSLDSLRSRPRCHGALFWMYEDCWGEVGWTIVDYYLRRKIAWYFVKRSFAPVRLILREADGRVRVTMANDTLEPVKGTLEFGRISTDGQTANLKQKAFTCPPLERKVIAEFKRDAADSTQNLWIARVKQNPDISPAILRTCDFRQLRTAAANLSVRAFKADQGTWNVEVASDVYAHAVHLKLPEEACPDDNYFDLLPGQKRVVTVRYTGTLNEKNVAIAAVR